MNSLLAEACGAAFCRLSQRLGDLAAAWGPLPFSLFSPGLCPELDGASWWPGQEREARPVSAPQPGTQARAVEANHAAPSYPELWSPPPRASVLISSPQGARWPPGARGDVGTQSPRGWLGQPREPPPSSLLNKASRESGSRIGAQGQAPSAGGAAESPRERRGQESRSLTENNLGSSFFLLFNSLIGQTGKLRSRGRKGRAGATPEEYSRPFSWRSRSPFLHPE